MKSKLSIKFTKVVVIFFVFVTLFNCTTLCALASSNSSSSSSSSFTAADRRKCIEDAIEYFGVFGIEFGGPSDTDNPYRILSCHPKHETKIRDSDFGVSFITKAGVHTTLYFKDLPPNFNIWDTETAIRDGRVTLIGVAHDSHNVWNLLFKRYKEFVVAVSGFGILCCLLALIINFLKVGANASNPRERSRVLVGLLYTGLGITGLGAIMLIFGFFWNLV